MKSKNLREKYKAQIQEMVAVCNELAALRFVCSQGGNISWRVEDDIILITPTKVAKATVKCDDIVIIDPCGNVLSAENGRQPTGETPSHLNILTKRQDFKSLIHAHPPVLTAFAITRNKLLERPILPEVVIEVGPVLSVEYKEPISQELAEAFDSVIEKSNAFLMENHGVLIGSCHSVKQTLELLEITEALAVSVQKAAVLGKVCELTRQDVLNLDNTLKSRNLPIPGAKGKNKSLVDLYFSN